MDNQSLEIILLVLMVGCGAAYWMKTNSAHMPTQPQQIQQPYQPWPTPPVQPQMPPPNVQPTPPVQPLAPPTTYAQALEQAKQTNKKIFLLFSRANCPACSDLAVTLANPKVKEQLNQFIVYKVNTLQDTEKLSQQFQISAVPTYFQIDPNGQVVSKNAGSMKPANFIQWLGGVVVIEERRPRLFERLFRVIDENI